MAIPQRETIINALVAALTEIADLKTVRVVSNINNKYPSDLLDTELPAVKLYMTDESTQYLPSRHAMNKISPDLYLFTLEWNKDSITYTEDLLKKIRDKIGAYLTLNFKCVNIDIRTIINIEVTYPLVMMKLNLAILYDGSINNL